MWNKIVNPKTGKKVNVNSESGKSVLKNYMKQIGGVRRNYINPHRSPKNTGRNKSPGHNRNPHRSPKNTGRKKRNKSPGHKTTDPRKTFEKKSNELIAQESHIKMDEIQIPKECINPITRILDRIMLNVPIAEFAVSIWISAAAWTIGDKVKKKTYADDVIRNNGVVDEKGNRWTPSQIMWDLSLLMTNFTWKKEVEGWMWANENILASRLGLESLNGFQPEGGFYLSDPRFLKYIWDNIIQLKNAYPHLDSPI